MVASECPSRRRCGVLAGGLSVSRSVAVRAIGAWRSGVAFAWVSETGPGAGLWDVSHASPWSNPASLFVRFAATPGVDKGALASLFRCRTGV